MFLLRAVDVPAAILIRGFFVFGGIWESYRRLAMDPYNPHPGAWMQPTVTVHTEGHPPDAIAEAGKS